MIDYVDNIEAIVIQERTATATYEKKTARKIDGQLKKIEKYTRKIKKRIDEIEGFEKK